MQAGKLLPRDPLILRLLLQLIRPTIRRDNMYRWVALLCVPAYGYAVWGPTYLRDWRSLVGGSLLIGGAALVFARISNRLTARTYRRYPEPQQAGKRLATLALGVVVLGTGTTASCLWAFDALHLFGYRYNPVTGPWIVAVSLFLDLVLVGFFEMTFAFNQWQTNELESEQLEHQQLRGQLDKIKQQVNPHFLFNSLNSLSVLIGEDPKQAERFVDEMAKVYRYLLQAHRSSQQPAQGGLTTLEAEVRFIESYAYLLRTRYGEGLDLRVVAAEAYPNGALLPLTLQTLVDNAIRHNVVSAARPLRIEIHTSSGQVRVKNSLQKRSVRVPMAREGLSGLQARYQLLQPAKALVVDGNEEYFSVSVPLASA